MYYTIKEKSNAELLSILLGISERDLRLFNLSDILQAPRSIYGIGSKKQLKIYALKEITQRLLNANARKPNRISTPQDIADILMPKFRYEVKEHFIIIVLDTKNQVVAMPTISVGTLNTSLVHPREVFNEALKYPTSSIILAHNHPSGTTMPSPEDIQTTKRLKEVAELLGIGFYDHLIVTADDYRSILSSAEWYMANNSS